MKRYPLLTEMLHDLALENDLRLKPESDWIWPDNASALESEARRLTANQRLTMIGGEVREKLRIIRNHDCLALDTFLDDVFEEDPRFHISY